MDILNKTYKVTSQISYGNNSKIKWAYMVLNYDELKVLENVRKLPKNHSLYKKLYWLDTTGSILYFKPNIYLEQSEQDKLQSGNVYIVIIPYLDNANIKLCDEKVIYYILYNNEAENSLRGGVISLLKNCNLFSESDIIYIKEYSNIEKVVLFNKPISYILKEHGINQLNNNQPVEMFYDDWYIYGIYSKGINKYNITFGLFKMRENETHMVNQNNKDMSEPSVSVSFIEFDIISFCNDLSNKSIGNISKHIANVIYPKSIHDRKQYSYVLQKYFSTAWSVTGYYIADLYVNKIVSTNLDGKIYVTKEVLNNNRILKFLEKYQNIYNKLENVVMVNNNEKLSIDDKNILLATHTANVNYYSFVAEIKFHADALCNKLAYFDKWYNSAIIADMGVGEESEYNPFNKYYNLNSDIVLEQIKYHANIYSIL